MIAAGFLVISILKAFSFLISMMALAVPRLHGMGETLYRNLVSPSRNDRLVESPSPTPIRLMRATAGKFAVSNLIYSIAAFLILWCSMGAYATLEREYHIMAQLGAESAINPATKVLR